MLLDRCTMLLAGLLILGSAVGCVAEAPLGPPGQNMTGAITIGASAGGETSDGGTETGTLSDTPACDPLADPLVECGPEMTCDLTSGSCVEALGAGAEDDLCADAGDCGPGLICASGRCRALCDVATDTGCGEDRVCAFAAAPIPGLCLPACQLGFDTCDFPGDACKRVIGADSEVRAACVSNPGFALTGDACLADPECAPGLLCTDASLHTLPCARRAASCCAPICDSFELPCFGVEPVCYALGIPDQESAGVCGAG